MISIKNLDFAYSGNWRKVFTNFSLDIESGKVVGLLGKNGTGKSTLLYLIAGLLHPRKGTVTYKGIETCRRLPETLSDVFIVPEEFDLPPVSLEQYIKVYTPFFPHFDRSQLERNLAAFELPADVHLGQLSMGQKKKVYMSFALAAGTPLLLMDEPTNGLDIPSKAQFRKVIAGSAHPDRTIIISTHQVRDVEMLIDHVVMIDSNTVLANADTQAISRRFVFEHRPTGADLSDAIFTEPTIGGTIVIAPNIREVPSPIDLERLFNLLLQHPTLLNTFDHNARS